MRLIMMGTGPFAVPTFRALARSRHEVAALVTKPPRQQPGRAAAPANPMRNLAVELGVPVLAPASVNVPQAQAELVRLRPDLFVVADYGQILAAETLQLAPLGGVNLHASLLPRYRGAAPVNWALYHGETETGVTVIHMTPRMDAGPILAQLSTGIQPDETASQLEARLAELGASLVLDTIEALASRRVEPRPQDPALASPARRLRKSDGLIDWSRPAQAIRNQIRAFDPWPACYTFWHRGSGEPVRLIISSAEVRPSPAGMQPGAILESRHELVVAAGQGALALTALQPAAKRKMTAQEFLRGHSLTAGDRFGS